MYPIQFTGGSISSELFSCVGSRTKNSHPVAPSALTHSPPRSSSESDQILPNAQHVSLSVIASKTQWRTHDALRNLRYRSNLLCQKISEERVNLGESLRAVHESAMKLRNKLRKRTGYIEGNSPPHYQKQFDHIEREFNAILSITSATSGSNPARSLDHALSLQIDSSATRSDAPA